MTDELRMGTPLSPIPGVVCPFDGSQLENWYDSDGYTQFICPQCDCRFRADAWVHYA